MTFTISRFNIDMALTMVSLPEPVKKAVREVLNKVPNADSVTVDIKVYDKEHREQEISGLSLGSLLMGVLKGGK